MKILVFVLFTVLMYPLGAMESTIDSDVYFPQRLSASELLTACSSSSLTHTGRRRNRYCYGFISGVEEGVRLYGRRHAKVDNRPVFCVPLDVSSRTLATAYVKYASGKNIDLRKPAVSVVLDALENAFPC